MKKINRTEFLQKVASLGLGASGALFLAACGGASQPERTSGTEEAQKKPQSMYSSEPKEVEVVEADCSSYNESLTEADISARANLGYIGESEKKGQNCTNCQYFVPDKFDGPCGGCQLFVNGAVNPQGWCKTWLKKA